MALSHSREAVVSLWVRNTVVIALVALLGIIVVRRVVVPPKEWQQFLTLVPEVCLPFVVWRLCTNFVGQKSTAKASVKTHGGALRLSHSDHPSSERADSRPTSSN